MMPETEAVETVEKTDTTGTSDDSPSQGLKLFGTDITKIPCMRSSLLNGYIGAIIGGLGGFFYTSKIRFACHSAFGSYWITSTVSWFACRYKLYRENKFWEDMKQKQRVLKKDEYNLPMAVEKLIQRTDGSDNSTPVKGS